MEQGSFGLLPTNFQARLLGCEYRRQGGNRQGRLFRDGLGWAHEDAPTGLLPHRRQ